MNITINEWIKGYSEVFLIACTLSLISIFAIAYFTGYEVVVTINEFHEAHIEFILIIAGILSTIYVMVKHEK